MRTKLLVPAVLVLALLGGGVEALAVAEAAPVLSGYISVDSADLTAHARRPKRSVRRVKSTRRSRRSQAPAVGVTGAYNPSGAVALALSMQGRPYRRGAAGPNAFDCSGLTSFAWRYGGGRALPRSSASQKRGVTPIAGWQLQPGDLVFGPGHVMMYVGGGMIVHAPHSGDVVRVAPLAGRRITGFGRP